MSTPLHIDMIEDPHAGVLGGPSPVSRAELEAALAGPAPAANEDLTQAFMAPVRRMIFTQDELDEYVRLAVAASHQVPAAAFDSWMQTATGRRFHPFDPKPEDIFIEDIAAALSKLCRYGGHCTRFYSVAEHSMLVSNVVPQSQALQALLHDATEAYCVDLPRPIKSFLPAYNAIEAGIWKAVATRFDLPLELSYLVHQADNDVLLAEREQIMVRTGDPWNVVGKAAPVHVIGLFPERAEIGFLARFKELTR